ncbi:MAG: DUF3098 domain-containing protein [Bacteroidia bacterium]|nr:DUF3098 domain-containing protein [Bacteroidia bacterium]MCC7534169.1 DUF3098 domain-containing protein [Bacteroidia bacterium]MCZ2140151.1 DUF3098 domain-containing protein [Bacteroidia bacterium]
MQKNSSKKATAKVNTPVTEQFFVFSKQNYILMTAGVLLIVLGFILMSGTEDIFSSTKLTVAPILVLAGFVVEIFAIMLKFDK